ncbi:phage major capsid protein [Primorskyibacter sp. S87]|uniref:phage major capsid protein n=1 Tax=Primorskyibacter sp. S87 TaxID=3415126 RepID=UPI003C7ABD0D
MTGEIQSPRVQKQLDEAIDRARAAKAYDKAVSQLDDAVAIQSELPNVMAKMDALEKQLKRDVVVQALPPAEPKRKGTEQVSLKSLRILSAAAFAGMKKHAEGEQEAKSIKELFGTGKHYAHVTRTATTVATTTAAGWGSELTQSMTMGFVDDLVQTSVAAQLMTRTGLTPFAGNNSLTWPMRADSDSGSMKPAWVGEAATIPVVEGNLSSVTLSRHKLGAIAMATNELIRTSQPGVLDMIEQFIRDDASSGLDDSMFNPDNDQILAVRPAALTDGANNQGSAGNTLANVISDLKWLRSQMSAANSIDTVFCMHTDRLMGLQMLQGANEDFPLRDEIERTGGLFGVPILASPHFPALNVVAIDAARVVVAMDPVEVDTSSAATLVMADAQGAAPRMSYGDAVTDDDDAVADVADGAIHVSDAATTSPATIVRSALQTDSTAIRLIMPVTWKMLKPAVAYLTGVSW